MTARRVTTYHAGGYDPAKPDNNIAAQRDEPIPDEADRADKIRAKIAAGIAQLESAYANWGALTAAQKDQAAKLCCLGVAKLARLALSQFDADEG